MGVPFATTIGQTPFHITQKYRALHYVEMEMKAEEDAEVRRMKAEAERKGR